MANDGTVRTWSNLSGMAVVSQTRGYTFGIVEDFFFKVGTSAIDSFLVNRGIQGLKALPVTAIVSIEKDAIIIRNDQAFISLLPGLPTAQKLLDYSVMSENGEEVGAVSEILVAIDPLVATRVIGFDFVTSSKRKKRFSANDILHYHANTIIITDQDAKKLR